jgi:hypothetical protein
VPRKRSVGGLEDILGGVVYGGPEFFECFAELGTVQTFLYISVSITIFGVWAFDELALQRVQGTQVSSPTISQIWVHLNT